MVYGGKGDVRGSRPEEEGMRRSADGLLPLPDPIGLLQVGGDDHYSAASRRFWAFLLVVAAS